MKRRNGSTLVELLVTIAIIGLLIGILLPTIFRAIKQSNRTRLAADLNAVGLALEAYKADFGDYPRPGPADAVQYRGAHVLCKALLSPGPNVGVGADGATGPGFRARPAPGADGAIGTADDTGTVTPAYLQSEKFAIGFLNGAKATDPSPPWNQVVMLDKDKSPILYYAARPGKLNLTTTAAPMFVAGTAPPATAQSLFNAYDNEFNTTVSPAVSWVSLAELRYMLGDTNRNGIVDAGETAKSEGPYLLWSAGPDGVFATAPSLSPTELPKQMGLIDDVTNLK